MISEYGEILDGVYVSDAGAEIDANVNDALHRYCEKTGADIETALSERISDYESYLESCIIFDSEPLADFPAFVCANSKLYEEIEEEL